MRKIEYREIYRQKCPMCGCKNKVFTFLHEDTLTKPVVGYSLKCCACGHYTDFLKDVHNNGVNHATYISGNQFCIKPSFCPLKDKCLLYRNGQCKPVCPEGHTKNDDFSEMFYHTDYVPNPEFK